MNRSSNRVPGGNTIRRTWCWRRWIVSGQQELWIGRLQAANCFSWALTERPQRARVLLEAYFESRPAAVFLGRSFDGQVRPVNARQWINPRPAPPTRIGRKLEIIHEKGRHGDRAALPRLHIPHGVAFGSGEHATTRMLLQALTSYDAWDTTTVLDLGAGSGVLALTARLLGARKIVAMDFDAEAVRTARQNEALNFSMPLVRWRCADAKKLRATSRYDLVLANLFSGILTEAASRITGCISPGGQLWLSGVLRSQEEEIIAAYRRQRLRLIRTVSRGKWVMLRWRKDL